MNFNKIISLVITLYTHFQFIIYFLNNFKILLTQRTSTDFHEYPKYTNVRPSRPINKNKTWSFLRVFFQKKN